MTKIIVAGAGHGGLIAAARLAKAGFDARGDVRILSFGIEPSEEPSYGHRVGSDALCGEALSGQGVNVGHHVRALKLRRPQVGFPAPFEETAQGPDS